MSTHALEADTAIEMGKKAAFSTVVGNALEWFDFASYAFFASIIANHFFPVQDHATAMIGTFAVFGIGLVARPLGALFFGRFGDVRGRKVALLIAMPMMGAGTLLIGLLPTYAQIGIAAPIGLVLCRLLQGFSAGGEVGNAIAFLIEWAPPRKRGFYSSLQQASAVGGTLLGSGLAASLSSAMGHELLASIGWRIPFVVGGLVIAPLGYYFRSKVDETPFFAEQEHGAANQARPASAARQSIGLLCLKTVGISTVWVVAFYTFLIYVPSFLSLHGRIPASIALWINTAGLLMMVISIVLSSIVSDIVGRKPLLIIAGLAFLLLSYPLFVLFVRSDSTALVFLGVVLSGGLVGIFAGTCPAAMAEMYPTQLRTTGVSIGFGLSTAIFGGFASLISESLIKLTGSPLSPSYYVILAAALSLPVIFSLKETAHAPLA